MEDHQEAHHDHTIIPALLRLEVRPRNLLPLTEIHHITVDLTTQPMVLEEVTKDTMVDEIRVIPEVPPTIHLAATPTNPMGGHLEELHIHLMAQDGTIAEALRTRREDLKLHSLLLLPHLGLHLHLNHHQQTPTSTTLNKDREINLEIKLQPTQATDTANGLRKPLRPTTPTTACQFLLLHKSQRIKLLKAKLSLRARATTNLQLDNAVSRTPLLRPQLLNPTKLLPLLHKERIWTWPCLTTMRR